MKEHLKYTGPQKVVFKGTPEDVIWKSDVTVLTENTKIYSRKDSDIVIHRHGALLGSFSDRKEYYTINDLLFGEENEAKSRLLDKLFKKENCVQNFEIYYINKLAQLENKWGTPNRIEVYDQDYGLHTSVGANGSYKFSVNNSLKLLSKIKGSSDILSQDMVREFFRSQLNSEIRNAISTVFHDNNFSLKDISNITSNEKQIANQIKEILKPHFNEYGVSLDKLYILKFSYDEDFLKEIAETRKKIIISKMKYEAKEQERQDYREDYKMMSESMVNINKSKQSENVHGTSEYVFCGECGTKNLNGAKFCNNCGNPVVIKQKKICSNCHLEMPEESRFCNNCGTKL